MGALSFFQLSTGFYQKAKMVSLTSQVKLKFLPHRFISPE